MPLRVKRAYDPPSAEDGTRYLIDRMWPRGLTSERLAVTAWRKDLAASAELCRWYNHDPKRFDEFRARYRSDLLRRPDLLDSVRQEARDGSVTLVYATREYEGSNASILYEMLAEPVVRAATKDLRGARAPVPRQPSKPRASRPRAK